MKTEQEKRILETIKSVVDELSPNGETYTPEELAQAFAERINALEEAFRSVLDWAPVPPDHWRAENQNAFMADMMKARKVLSATTQPERAE